MATNLFQQYQASAITQSDPVRLVELMYEGAIRFTNLAIKSIDEKDFESTHNHILRAYAIVAELMATLDFEQGGDIAVHLEQCYDYILHLLKEANIKKEKAQLEQVLQMIEPLLNAWQEAFPDKTAAAGLIRKDKDNQAGAPEGNGENGEPKRKPAPKPKSLDVVG